MNGTRWEPDVGYPTATVCFVYDVRSLGPPDAVPPLSNAGAAVGGLVTVTAVTLTVVFADAPGLRTWCTIFLAVTVQAFPFLVLGVLISGAVAAFVPDGALARVLPRRAVLAVPLAGVSGALLAGCE
ncbi:permease, partial [Frankia sp. Cas3]|uniref:permease n=1 Tax=Frankia sp. Cas3 TaxID=3073926 RepID=UPI002AD51E28